MSEMGEPEVSWRLLIGTDAGEAPRVQRLIGRTETRPDLLNHHTLAVYVSTQERALAAQSQTAALNGVQWIRVSKWDEGSGSWGTQQTVGAAPEETFSDLSDGTSLRTGWPQTLAIASVAIVVIFLVVFFVSGAADTPAAGKTHNVAKAVIAALAVGILVIVIARRVHRS